MQPQRNSIYLNHKRLAIIYTREDNRRIKLLSIFSEYPWALKRAVTSWIVPYSTSKLLFIYKENTNQDTEATDSMSQSRNVMTFLFWIYSDDNNNTVHMG